MQTAKGIFEGLDIRDGLTRLHSRQFFYEKLEKEFSRAMRYKTPLSLIFIDLDGFKKLNDQYGHLSGDEVLKQVSRVIRDVVRDSDVAARYAGDEFCVLLPNSGLEGARTLANRISLLISELEITGIGNQHVTVSIGIATYKGDKDYPFDQMLQVAEKAMYRAKNAMNHQIMISEI
jgi:diguanylate cyclase (GGDEF)-like protein